MLAIRDHAPRERLPAPGVGWSRIVKRNELHKFVVLPKRWIVERTLAWISRNRRLARDFERYARTVAAFVRLAMIRIMLRRLTGHVIQPESQLPGSALRRIGSPRKTLASQIGGDGCLEIGQTHVLPS